MATRGRTSLKAVETASQGVVTLPQRPKPPADLPAREKAIWKSIVDAQSADWFSAGDLPILAAYCRAVALHERASEESESADLTIFGPQGGQVVNPVFKVQDMAARQMASLAVKLRLTQSARWTEQRAATKHRGGTAPKRPWEG